MSIQQVDGTSVNKGKLSAFKQVAPEGTLITSFEFTKELPYILVSKEKYVEQKKRFDRAFAAGQLTSNIKYILNVLAVMETKNGKNVMIAFEEYVNPLDEFLGKLKIEPVSKQESKKNSFTDPANRIKYILLTASEGLMYLHNNDNVDDEDDDNTQHKNLVHRNISPSNIAVCIEGNHYVGKIFNLSMSKHVSEYGLTSMSVDYTVNLSTAPEIFDSLEYAESQRKSNSNLNPSLNIGIEADIWGLGVVYFFALTGKYPFDTVEKIKRKEEIPEYDIIHNSEILEKWDCFFAEQLISTMLQRIPSDRPTIKQVLNHPFFWDDIKKEHFLAAASQYVQGFYKIRQKFNNDCNKFVENWKGGLDETIHHMIEESCKKYQNQSKDTKDDDHTEKDKEDPYGDTASEFLRLLRNFPKHIGEEKNSWARKIHFKNTGVVEFFLRRKPEFFIHCYSFFNRYDYSKYDTLRKFYCSCYLGNKFEHHNCSCDENFNPKMWIEIEADKKNEKTNSVNISTQPSNN